MLSKLSSKLITTDVHRGVVARYVHVQPTFAETEVCALLAHAECAQMYRQCPASRCMIPRGALRA